MAIKHVIDVFKDAAGDIVIREVDPSLMTGARGSISVHPRDVPALVDMLNRAIEGLAHDPEDSPTVRNMQTIGGRAGT